MKQLLLAAASIVLAACSPQNHEAHEESGAGASTAAASTPAQDRTESAASAVPAGAYTLDKAHASLIFRVNHLGFSNYTARFKQFDAQLQFDPANLEASKLDATVDARSIETDFPDPAKYDFNAQLQGEQWLHTAQFPEMTFRSTKVEQTGPNTVRVHGELTLRGVTRPMTLDATFNGGYVGHPMDPNARIGFSARGSLKRSEYGISFGLITPESPLGVGDDVEVSIEAEFNGPAWADAPATEGTA